MSTRDALADVLGEYPGSLMADNYEQADRLLGSEWLAEHDREVTAAAREFLASALEESDADEGDGWDVEVDARTVLRLLPPVPARTPGLSEGEPEL